jgi:hypothetical protein
VPASLYRKVRRREHSSAHVREQLASIQEQAAEAKRKNLDVFLARVHLAFWLAAAGPALRREVQRHLEDQSVGAELLNAAIDEVSDALRKCEITGFRVNANCRWNGQTFIAIWDGAFAPLCDASLEIRCAAIVALTELDTRSLPTRST